MFQPYATASFDAHSTLATVNVLRAVIGAAAYVGLLPHAQQK